MQHAERAYEADIHQTFAASANPTLASQGSQDEADAARCRFVVGEIAFAESHGAGFGGFESRKDPQQRRLARSRRAEQRDELAVVDGQRYGGERWYAEKLFDTWSIRIDISVGAAGRGEFVPVSPLER